MCCIAHCKFGETVEHSVSSVLEASVSGVLFPRTTRVYCTHVLSKESFPIHSLLSPNPIPNMSCGSTVFTIGLTIPGHRTHTRCM